MYYSPRNMFCMSPRVTYLGHSSAGRAVAAVPLSSRFSIDTDSRGQVNKIFGSGGGVHVEIY